MMPEYVISTFGESNEGMTVTGVVYSHRIYAIPICPLDIFNSSHLLTLHCCVGKQIRAVRCGDADSIQLPRVLGICIPSDNDVCVFL